MKTQPYETMKKSKVDSCDTQNKLKYEEWVYKNENPMTPVSANN